MVIQCVGGMDAFCVLAASLKGGLLCSCISPRLSSWRVNE